MLPLTLLLLGDVLKYQLYDGTSCYDSSHTPDVGILLEECPADEALPCTTSSAAGCFPAHCTSDDGAGGEDCHAGQRYEGCTCSPGYSAKVIASIGYGSDGLEYYEYECCNDGTGIDGEYCGEYQGHQITLTGRKVATEWLATNGYTDIKSTMPGTFCDADSDTMYGDSSSRFDTVCLGTTLWLRLAFQCEADCVTCYTDDSTAIPTPSGLDITYGTGAERMSFTRYNIDRDEWRTGSCHNRWYEDNDGPNVIDATTGEFYLKNEINSIYTTEDNYPTFLDGVDGSTQFWQNEPNCKAATWAGVIKQNLYSDDSCSEKTSHNIYYSANLVSDTEMCFTGVNNWLDADRAYLDLKDVFHVKVTMDCSTFSSLCSFF